MIKLAAMLLAITVIGSASDKFSVVYDRTVISDMLVFQQPASNARGVQFLQNGFKVFCDGACTVTVWRDGPAMTCSVPANCEITPVPLVTSATPPRFKVYYTASSLTGAVKIGSTKFSGYMPFNMDELKMTRNGTNVNYYVVLESASGSAINMVVNAIVVQE